MFGLKNKKGAAMERGYIKCGINADKSVYVEINNVSMIEMLGLLKNLEMKILKQYKDVNEKSSVEEEG